MALHSTARACHATGTHLCCSCFSAAYFRVRVPGAAPGPDVVPWFPGREARGLSAFTSCGESWALPPRKTHTVGNSLNLGSGFGFLAANNDKRQQDVTKEKVPQSINLGKQQVSLLVGFGCDRMRGESPGGFQHLWLFIIPCDCSLEDILWSPTIKQQATPLFLTLALSKPYWHVPHS